MGQDLGLGAKDKVCLDQDLLDVGAKGKGKVSLGQDLGLGAKGKGKVF